MFSLFFLWNLPMEGLQEYRVAEYLCSPVCRYTGGQSGGVNNKTAGAVPVIRTAACCFYLYIWIFILRWYYSL